MVLRGRFQGTCQCQEVPLVETLPPLISPYSSLALVGPLLASPPGSDSPISQVFIDAPVGGVSYEDPLPSDTEEEEALTGLNRCSTRAASK